MARTVVTQRTTGRRKDGVVRDEARDGVTMIVHQVRSVLKMTIQTSD
jgi:hypothetical protein